MSERILTVRDLCTSFPQGGNRLNVVDRVSFDVNAGETLALVGESGCGKSMTALSVMRLVPKPGRVASGTIHVGDQDVRALPVTEMRRVRGGEVSMIFQEPMTSLNPVQRCGRQIVEAIRLHHAESKEQARTRARDLFGEVGIPDPDERLDAYPHQLSGGMRQRVMIAMALASRPKLLIADEPTTALDVTIQAQILDLLRSLQRDLGMAILLITHDVGVVNELADRVLVMYAGRIAEEGQRREVLAAPGHPYTRGLLRSLPGVVERGDRLDEIEGVVPPPGEWTRGCRFSNRCPIVFDPCADTEPERFTLNETHGAWCHALKRDGGVDS
ncbi:MAG: ABC transporter ATP-binding protein [Candidatus Binatia bacterium]|nr:ABC transporter ATP-binding protein [Candidatus Binatia bacterium]